jgi:predicted transposase/invertase (TIGR01784 family)
MENIHCAVGRNGNGRPEMEGERAGLDAVEAAEPEYRRFYRLCREMLDRREMLRELDDREKDLIAQQFAGQEYLNLTSDWAFKYLFRKHKDLLLMLLRDILNEDIKDLEYRDSEMVKLFAGDKTVIFDLLCITSDGSEFIVEMQKTWRKDQRDRLLYYGAALIRDQIKAGTREYLLKQVKIICIMDYEDAHESVQENKIVFQYRLAELETCEPYGHQLSIYLVELPRVMRLTDNFENPVAGWCQIFRNIATFADTRDGKEGRFSEVVKKMKVRGLTDKEIEEYFSDMYTLEDYKPYIDGAAELGYRKGLEEGREEGREEGEKYGLEKGRKEERGSIVLKMKDLNIPLEQIMSITGLSAEEINKYN